MNKIIKLFLPIIGNIELRLNTSEDLYKFTQRQLRNYIISESTISDTKGFVSISAKDIKHRNFENIVLGRDVNFENNQLNFIKNSRVQKLSYIYDFNNTLSLSIEFKKKSLYYLKSLLYPRSRYGMNHLLFYKTILYPIFSLYTIEDNYALIHGSLIKVNDKYIVLAGLDGIGKSSLSNELVLMGHQILADNFVLFNGRKFTGLNMPIRLDLNNDTRENIIYEDDNLKEVLYNYIENEMVEVDKVYFLSIGEKLSIKAMDKNIVTQNWNLINNGAGEILEANLFNLPFLYQNSLSKSLDIGSYRSYSFSIPKGKIKEAVKELICQLSI